MISPSAVTARVDDATGRFGPSVLRWIAALLWLANVNWKIPPDFGRSEQGCRQFCRFVEAGVDDPVLPGSAWFFESVVSPNLQVFGWGTLVVEAALVAALVAGRYVRIAAVVGIAQSLGIGAAVANASGEWYWSYVLMMALHAAVLVTVPAERPQSARTTAVVAAVYGVAVAIVNAGAGFTGSGDETLFDQPNDFPGDWGRGTFPGSIAIGLVLVALGVIGWVLATRLDHRARRPIGLGLVVVAAAVLVTYDPDGLAIGLAARPATVCIAAALGLALAVPSRPTDHEPDEIGSDETGAGVTGAARG
jgi:thiosulfate dehydrogenase (quinone) large subunit